MSTKNWTVAVSVVSMFASIACGGEAPMEGETTDQNLAALTNVGGSGVTGVGGVTAPTGPLVGNVIVGPGRPTVPTPGGTLVVYMTVGECKNLGCETVEAANCPAITHDFGTRHWACKCSGGSSCITENSPH